MKMKREIHRIRVNLLCKLTFNLVATYKFIIGNPFLNVAVFQWLCMHLCSDYLCVKAENGGRFLLGREPRGEEGRFFFSALATSVAMPTVYLDFGWVMRGAWKVYSGRQGFRFIQAHSYKRARDWLLLCFLCSFLNMLHGLNLSAD